MQSTFYNCLPAVVICECNRGTCGAASALTIQLNTGSISRRGGKKIKLFFLISYWCCEPASRFNGFLSRSVPLPQERIFLTLSNYIFTAIFVAEMSIKVRESGFAPTHCLVQHLIGPLHVWYFDSTITFIWCVTKHWNWNFTSVKFRFFGLESSCTCPVCSSLCIC